MPINPYTPCPGGTGKKVKFCCKDLLNDLEKIGRMIEGDQFMACLGLVERLRQTRPDRACLLATQVILQRILDRGDEARQTNDYFLQKHPNNPLALAESAMFIGTAEGGRAALPILLRAIALAGNVFSKRLYVATGIVAQLLARQQHYLAASALVRFQVSINDEPDEQVVTLLMSLNAAPRVPLIVKDARGLQVAADDAPYKAELNEIIIQVAMARWPEAIEKLERLIQQYPQEPVLWRNLGRLRAWAIEPEAAIEALRTFASLDVPWEDRAEAEALGLFLRDDPLGDKVDVFDLTYTVRDAEAVRVGLAESLQAAMAEIDPAAHADEDSPPPKLEFLLFDKPAADTDAELTLETVPRVLCRGVLFGKETDREARLEVMQVVEEEVQQVTDLLGRLAPGAVESEPRREQTDTASRSRDLLSCRWRLPNGSSREQFRRMADAYLEDALLGRWVDLPLGVFDGRSPRQAALDPQCHGRLLAAILLVEHWLDENDAAFDCNRLRAQLGLPVLEPIVAEEGSVAGIPVARLARVQTAELCDEDVLIGYRRAVASGARKAVEKFGRELIGRPTLADRGERFQAYRVLARMADEPEEAFRLLNEGRQAAVAAGDSCGPWDLAELELHFEHTDEEQVLRLLEHLERKHSDDSEVMDGLVEVLSRFGILRPGGAPAAPPPTAAASGPPAAEEPSIVVPGDAAGGSGEIWTPGGQTGGEDKPKLWTPDMG